VALRDNQENTKMVFEGGPGGYGHLSVHSPPWTGVIE